ncbi:MAG: Radical SAM domain protein [Candidatus Daviesbacteria bacterium GW2011_GWA2_40_9]|uniref:Radical SAM domain protein n=1 Tax=Candidatus Daviesbacteria bacterium GW2011_GWA2_40_9 TaxID=1618424 RepID=A0A0G0U257_9BACT|nr:MAG: Radical SAM domain protein [Candidatus Daviesbacteria bacterium GW2011_GWA2_40_9]
MGIENTKVNVDSLPNAPKQIYKTLSAPVTAQWELTDWCNQRCFHCYNYWRNFSVTITGGEPLPFIKKYAESIGLLRDADVDLKVNSNLTLFDREYGHILKDLGITSLLTSVISYNPNTHDRLCCSPGSHKKISDNIRRALDMGFRVSPNMVVSKLNLGDIEGTAKYVKSLGLTSFLATKATAPPNCPDFSQYSLSLEELKIMFNLLKKAEAEYGVSVDSLEPYPMCHFQDHDQLKAFGQRVCGAGKSICTIGFDGAVRPCSHADQVSGIISDQNSFKELWLKLRPWRTDEYLPEECSKCSIRNVCYGGCRVEACVVNGDLKSRNPYCDPENIPNINSLELTWKNDDVKFNPGSAFQFNPHLKYRGEEFGGILFLSPKAWVGVNEYILTFYKKRKDSPFVVKDLSDDIGVERGSLVETMHLLYKKNIIEERR